MATDRAPGVDFFQRQERARGATAKLTILFLLSVVAVVAVIDLIVYLAVPATTASGRGAAVGLATIVTVLIIGGGTLSKMASLRGGGAALALSMGAIPIDPTTADPMLRRYVHVVEEMSIASGVAMPALFVLPNDPGINAFAAGYSPADAVITVTVGALQTLNRDELQGVIGHEFSHILNGDMRINIRMIGVLGGLLVLGLVGLRILQFGGRGRDKSVGPILAFGIAALVLGFVGQFLAGLVKAAMSRQREWLADAASVQFTRQTQGLTGALKKIAGLPEGSELVDSSSEKQVNHMLFGDGRRPFLQLWATHPPLDARIRALDPAFSAQQLRQLKGSYAAARPNGLAEDAQLGLVEAPPRPRAPMPGGPGPAGPAPTGSAPTGPVPAGAAAPAVTVDPAAVSAAVGTFTLADLERAAALSQQLDPRLRELAGAATSAVPLVLALLLEPSGPVRDRQLQALEQRVGPHIMGEVTAVLPEVSALTPQLRLPLVGIALPALAARPLDQIAALQATLQALVLGDGRYTLFEYCLTRLASAYLGDRLEPRQSGRPGRARLAQCRDSALMVLSVVAAAGNPDPMLAQRAFDVGVARLGLPPTVFAPPADFVATLDASWPALDALVPSDKRGVVEALVAASAHDGVLHVNEAQLLRVACALLHCPTPMLLA